MRCRGGETEEKKDKSEGREGERKGTVGGEQKGGLVLWGYIQAADVCQQRVGLAQEGTACSAIKAILRIRWGPCPIKCKWIFISEPGLGCWNMGSFQTGQRSDSGLGWCSYPHQAGGPQGNKCYQGNQRPLILATHSKPAWLPEQRGKKRWCDKNTCISFLYYYPEAEIHVGDYFLQTGETKSAH